MSTIELRGVAKRFGSNPVLTDVELIVPDGTTTAVLGASGSGKTTLLRLIAGFEQVDAGTVAIEGNVVDDGVRFVRPQHRSVGYVPQEGALFPHLTVMGNVGFGVARHERAKVAELVEMVGLGGLGRRYPHQLSGGQQQRVALARALVIAPSVVLLDEPFSSLDASLRTGLRRDVARILAETRTTTVLVTHDQNEALAFADRIAVLRQGHMVVSADPHELYRDPPDITAATSIGEANILPAVVHAHQARCVLGVVALHGHALPADGPAQLLLRPEQLVLHLERGNDRVNAVVVDAQFHGHDTLVDLVVNDAHRQPLLARVPGDLVLGPGQPVWVEVQGLGRVWSVDGRAAPNHDGHATVVGATAQAGGGSLWLAPALDPAPGSPPVPPGRADPGRSPAPATPGGEPPAGPGPPRRRRRLRVALGLAALAVAVVAAFALVQGGSNPSAVGPVVFHGSVSLSGEFHTQETFIDAGTADKVSSCAQAAAHGDRPQMGPDTWLVPTPPLNNTVEIEIGTSARGYHGPGRYSRGVLADGNGAMDVGPESYLMTSTDGTVSMTVNADGSGNVTFTDAPGDDDNPHPGWHGGISGTIAWTCTS
jgi:iron(III) transport system ATP-binding protein